MKKLLLLLLLSCFLLHASCPPDHVTINLKDNKPFFLKKDALENLMRESQTVRDIVQESGNVTEYNLATVDLNNFIFINNVLRTNNWGEIERLFKTAKATLTPLEYKTLIDTIRFFDIERVIRFYESRPALKAVTNEELEKLLQKGKRRVEPELREEPKKIKTEMLSVTIPEDQEQRKAIAKIIDASGFLSNAIKDLFNVEKAEQLKPKEVILVPNITQAQWYLLISVAKKVSNFSNEEELKTALLSLNIAAIKQLLINADFLDMSALVKIGEPILIEKCISKDGLELAVKNLAQFYKDSIEGLPAGIIQQLEKIIDPKMKSIFHYRKAISKKLVDGRLKQFKLSQDGTKIIYTTTTENEGSITIYDVEKESSACSLVYPNEAWIFDALISPNNAYAAAIVGQRFQNGDLILINLTNCKVNRFPFNIKRMILSSDSKHMFFLQDFEGNKTKIFKWDLKSDKPNEIKEINHKIESFALSADGNTLALSAYDKMLILDVQTDEEKEISGSKQFTWPRPVIKILGFTEDGYLINEFIKGDLWKIYTWDLAAIKILSSYEIDDTSYQLMNISPDGNYLAATSEGPKSLKLLALPSREIPSFRVVKFFSVPDPIDFLSLSNEANRIAVVSVKGTEYKKFSELTIWQDDYYQYLENLTLEQSLFILLIEEFSRQATPGLFIPPQLQKGFNDLPENAKSILKKKHSNLLFA